MNGPMLWFLNRGTGIVLLVLMTISVVLGVLSARSRAGGAAPGFVRSLVHRNVALLAVALTVIGVVVFWWALKLQMPLFAWGWS